MKIFVLGDIILDKYRYGRFTKDNPESLGEVFKIEKEEYKLGGAASVANVIFDNGIDCTLIGVVGSDSSGGIIKSFCDKSSFILVENNRITPVKERFVCDGGLFPHRFDTENTDNITEITCNNILSFLSTQERDVLLISDYAKGCVSDELLDGISKLGFKTIVVDPCKNKPWGRYPEGAIIKANLDEARDEIIPYDDNNKSSIPLANLLLRNTERDNVVITSGKDGIFCKSGGKIVHVYGIKTSTIDVCGAGDVVLANIGMELSKGHSLINSCYVANSEAARKTQYIGVYNNRK